jgi:hypothetical protein
MASSGDTRIVGDVERPVERSNFSHKSVGSNVNAPWIERDDLTGVQIDDCFVYLPGLCSWGD